MKTFLSVHWVSLLFPISFLFLKSSSLSIRLSDTNVYFYTAYKLLEGKLLYADIFFTNFPIFPYLSALYLFLSGNNIFFYYFSATLEVALTALIIYQIIYKIWKSRVYALTAQSLYLFSFIVLATSDHQSGVFAASFFAILSYYFYDKKKYIFVGIFAALAVLTKAYFIPLAITYLLTIGFQKDRGIYKYVASGLITAFFVLLPFLIFSRNEMIAQIIQYSLTRSAGTNKLEVLQFFSFRDTILFLILLINTLFYKNYRFFSLFSIFSLVFVFLYQDIYYLYLNNTVPILILSLPVYQHFISQKMSLQKMVIPSVIALYLFYNIFVWLSQYKSLQSIQNYDSLVNKIKTEKPERIYGANDIAPLIAFDTNTQLLNDTIDTNGNIFRKGILNANDLTKKAIESNTIVVIHGAVYPQYNIEDHALDEIVIKDEILEKCTLIESHPVYAEGISNRISIFKCY